MKPCPQCVELGKLLLESSVLISSVQNPTAEWEAKKEQYVGMVEELLRKLLKEEGGK